MSHNLLFRRYKNGLRPPRSLVVSKKVQHSAHSRQSSPHVSSRMARYRMKDKHTTFGKLPGHQDPEQDAIIETNRNRTIIAARMESLFDPVFLPLLSEGYQAPRCGWIAYGAGMWKDTNSRTMMVVKGLDKVCCRVSYFVIV